METMNIIIAGVGGQGLVLATKIIAEAAFQAGFDVKTNDVVGLSQRGGTVWGSVKFGDQVHSPNVLPGTGDLLLGMDPLEALRWSHLLKKDGQIILNTRRVYPTPVLLEKEAYPEEAVESLPERFAVTSLDAAKEAKESGNAKAANTVLLGVLSAHLPIAEEIWMRVLKANVPPKAVEENLRAFARGREYGH